NTKNTINLKTFIIMKTQNRQFNLIVLLTILFFFFNLAMFASNEPKPTNETVKTLFGTEMSQNEVVKVTYQNVSFYVAIGSPIANLYKNDYFKFQVFMSLHLDDYKNENKIFLNS